MYVGLVQVKKKPIFKTNGQAQIVTCEHVLMQGSDQISNFEWFGKNRQGQCFYV
jgi:hypothetical protein